MRVPKIFLLLLALLPAGCGGPADLDTKTAEASGEKPATETTAQMPERDDEAAQAASGSPELSTVTIHPSGGEEVEVRVKIADDLAEQTRGLMHRTALAEDRGMLFVYSEEEVRSFWMRNTLIPLSIAYIDSEGRIVDIQDMKPLDDDLPHYVSAEPAQYALEVNQGFFEESGIEVGDRAELPE
jgi:uncharacterized membrane protein (UPF0127 family)